MIWTFLANPVVHAITLPSDLTTLPPAPVAESQSLTVLSLDADTTSLPSGENATAQTESRWPSSVQRAVRLFLE
jgi:hypothetical protein